MDQKTYSPAIKVAQVHFSSREAKNDLVRKVMMEGGQVLSTIVNLEVCCDCGSVVGTAKIRVGKVGRM